MLTRAAVSTRYGGVGDERGRLVWADVAWIDEQTAPRAARHDAYEAAIRADETSLARRFPRCHLVWALHPAVVGVAGLVGRSATDRTVRPRTG